MQFNILIDIREKTPIKTDLFSPQRRDTDKDKRLMNALDQINLRMGKRAIQFAAEGVHNFEDEKATWQMNRNRLSPRATTRWDELKRVN